MSSAVLHGIVLAGAFGASTLLAPDRKKPDDRIEVAIREVPPPPPREPPAAPAAPEPEPEVPKAEPARPPEPPPEPPKPRRQEERRPPARELPPDPIDVPPTPAPAERAPYRVVGLNLESTVGEGSGPAFAVGNTRMGATERIASDAREVAPLPKTLEAPAPRANRVAARVPTAGVELKRPRRLRPVVPVYPEEYRAQAIEGSVVVRVTIGPDGRVGSVDIARGSGYPKFDEAAKEAALREVFAPAEENGRPIEYTITFTVRFRLNE